MSSRRVGTTGSRSLCKGSGGCWRSARRAFPKDWWSQPSRDGFWLRHSTLIKKRRKKTKQLKKGKFINCLIHGICIIKFCFYSCIIFQLKFKNFKRIFYINLKISVNHGLTSNESFICIIFIISKCTIIPMIVCP